MQFQVLGFPVFVQGAFWFTAILLGVFPLLGGNITTEALMSIPIWVAVVFAGILVHELGHALVMRRYRLTPEIVLHGFGGATAARGLGGLKRHQRIFVSAAGPLAGLLFGGVTYALIFALGPYSSDLPDGIRTLIDRTFGMLLWVNVIWSLFNLLPILPLDGGHILEDILGPRRIRAAYIISLAVGMAVIVLAATNRQWFIALIIGLFTWNTYGRYRELGDGAPRQRTAPPPPPIPPELVAALAEAKRALENERLEEARTHAELILTRSVPTAVRLEALTVIGWSHLLEGRIDDAANAVAAIQKQGTPDAALAGAIRFHKGDDAGARKIFEAARANGDDRKEVVGPLIQILIKQGEVARAAAIALDIVETLSDDDVRQMAEIAAEHEAHAWAGRLYECLFERHERADDAYEAARHRSLDGDVAGALVLIERAVRAGFSDASRLWSDKALTALRDGEGTRLEDLLPRPSR